MQKVTPEVAERGGVRAAPGKVCLGLHFCGGFRTMSSGLARQRIATLLFYSTVLLLAYLLYLLFSPFLTPLAWAAIFAALFHSPYRRLKARWGKSWAAAASTAVVTLVIVVPMVLVTTAFIQEATLAISSI